MVDDGDPVSDVEETNELKMDGEKMYFSTGECESKSDSGEMNREIDDVERRTLSLEDKASFVGGDLEHVLEDRVDMESEFDDDTLVLVDGISMPGVAEATASPVALEKVELHVVSAMTEQPLISECLEMVSEELRVGELWSENSDQRTVEIKLGSKMQEGDAKEYKIFSNEGCHAEPSIRLESATEASDPRLEKKAEELAPIVSNMTNMVHDEVILCELETDTAAEGNMLDPQLENKQQDKSISDGICKDVLSIGDMETVKQLPLCGLINLHDEVSMGEDASDHKFERDMGDVRKNGDMRGENEVLVDSLTVGNATDSMEGVNQTCLEGVEIHVRSMNSDNALVVISSKQVYVHNVTDDMEYGGAGYVEDKSVAENCILNSRTRMTEEEKMVMESTKAFTLAKNVNAAEANEVAVIKEEQLSRNTEIEAESSVKLETRDVVKSKSVQLADAELETCMGNTVNANGMLDEQIKMETDETASDVDEPGIGMYDSSVPPQDEEDETLAGSNERGAQDTEMETDADAVNAGKTAGGKRKRGKFSKCTSNSRAVVKNFSRKKVGEDVCFICFDGGELVLCDRRGCPKAYHPSCVNRDEAFFRSKGQWNCGWHLCSICAKNVHYMCYTCTYSLCKNCIKDGVILCVRENKGFCETCMITVTLIEDYEQGRKDVEVDFDDKSSWEYLFKDYYMELKDNLSLSFPEISEARNPWKGASTTGTSKQDSSEGQADAKDGGSGSEDSAVNIKLVKPKRRKEKKIAKSQLKKMDLLNSVVTAGDRATSLNENSDWASRELLAFVSHVKNGNTTALSPLDVQALLLEYIKRNKLRDPRRKSQIICDARLGNLFGKPRVGHIEMLKLLESHFLLKDEQNDVVQGSVVDTENLELENDGNTDTKLKTVKDKRKSRKKGNKAQSNLDDYAAIDMHNIGLIYLRRKLMEDLLEDADTFPERVIGTFVRIRISGSNQKQDLYRLVQVVGTSKAPQPYKSGKKTTDVRVEILNLNKTEMISVDTISNQDFNEEECKRLRQSIKCGFINPLTVGAVLDKALDLQGIRVNDWLESETLRLSHLRDRASDLGRRKELRDCVEKLQLLKTPEERRRRLEESPKVHVDPKMDPCYESEDSDSETGNNQPESFRRLMSSGISYSERFSNSPRGDSSSKESANFSGRVSSRTVESSRNPFGNISSSSSLKDKMMYENPLRSARDKERHQFDNLGKVNSVTISESAELAQPRSGTVSVTTTSPVSLPSGVVEQSLEINESEKIWHYVDPSGKDQGPFSMVQLRKWNSTGYFPADLRIWRATEKQENAFLLTVALAGKFPRKLSSVDNIFAATDSLHGSQRLADHSVQSFGISSNQDKERSLLDNIFAATDSLYGSQRLVDQDKERSNANHISQFSLSNMATEKLSQNGTGALLSPAQRQIDAGWNAHGLLPSTTLLPNVETQSPNPASVLTSASPTKSSNQATLVTSATAVQMQPQPVQNGSNQAWDTGAPPQPQVQNSSGDSSWPIGPPENSTSMGMVTENKSTRWGPMLANPNMSWMNPTSGTTNIQGTTSWVPPVGNTVANVQGPVPCWAPNQGWRPPPVHGPGNGWGAPPSGQTDGRNWNRQPSFNGGGGSSRFKRDAVCPYNASGRCKKGARCDYMHV